MTFISKVILSGMVCMGIIATSSAQSAFSVRLDSLRKTSSYTQNRRKPRGPKPIKKEVSFGYRLHTNGWSIYTDIGKVKSRSYRMSDKFYRVNFWQIELSEKKDPKQEKLTADQNTSGNTSNYCYGKINNFYAVKLGYGVRKLIAGKPDPGAVSIHWAGVLSGSLGMLKPYYLNVYSDPNAIKYSDATQGNFLDQRLILGSAGFGTGLSELKMIPGGHIKSMLHFDFAANRKSVMAIETGFSFDYYAEPIAIMANQKAEPYFFDIFVAFQFGKRW